VTAVRRLTDRRVFPVVALAALAIVWLVPVITALMTSVRPLPQIRRGWWHFAGATITSNNYARAWNAGLSDAVLNSLIIAIGATAVTTALGTLAAYAFARLRFRGKALAYFLLISTMIVPIQIILIPLVPWFQTLGLNEGDWLPFLGIILVHTAFGAGWAIFMLTTFFAEVPRDVIEAAHVDGASHLDIFRRVVLPLAIPGILSFAIIDFIFVWNDLLLALTLLGQDFHPLTVALSNLSSPQLAQNDLVAAGSIIAVLPPLLLFAVLNRFYVRGMFAGSVK
jgi:ABC-type glycerol-3-phosphate transport system permease component